MKPRHKKTYEALKAYGFSPFKAAEIVLDAQRGGAYGHHALVFVKLVYGRV